MWSFVEVLESFSIPLRKETKQAELISPVCVADKGKHDKKLFDLLLLLL